MKTRDAAGKEEEEEKRRKKVIDNAPVARRGVVDLDVTQEKLASN